MDESPLVPLSDGDIQESIRVLYRAFEVQDGTPTDIVEQFWRILIDNQLGQFVIAKMGTRMRYGAPVEEKGKVLSYGAVAKLAGKPNGSRHVVRTLHSSSQKYDLPWHRVVNSKGEIAVKDPIFYNEQRDLLGLPYHQMILNGEIPLSIGGGIGQSRTYMLLLRKAHLGECSVTIWPKVLRDMCAKKNIHVLQ